MRNIAAAVLGGIFCLMANSCPVTAAQLSQIAFTGIWRGGAYSNDQTGQFSHCVAYAPYRSGIVMFVSINRTLGWTLAFADPAWNLRAGEQIPLSMIFDGNNPWAGSASVLNEHMAVVPMAENSTLINAFRSAYEMQIQALGHTFPFNLDGTSRLMVQLAQCVQTQLAIERGEPRPHYAEAPARPLNPAPAPPPVNQRPQNPSLELEATRIASNLLLQANLPHAHLLSSADTPPSIRGRGAAWTSDAGVGAVEILSATAAQNASQVASQVITSDGIVCKGDFASGRSNELLDDKVITKAFTGCKDSSGTRAYRYFIIQATRGDFIVYALTDEAGAPPPTGDAPTSDARFQAAAVKAAFSQ